MSDPSILNDLTIQYFPNFAGRALPIYLFLEDAGIPYTKLDLSSFWANKTDLELYPFNQVPIVILKNGMRLAQMDAILRFFARVIPGHVPQGTEEEIIRVDMLACSVEDFINAYQEAVWSKDHQADLLSFATTKIPKYFAQYNHLLSLSSTPSILVSSAPNPTHPEYTLLSCVRAVLRLRPAALEGSEYPHLEAWYEDMSRREGVKAFLTSEKCPVQLNYLRTAEERVM